jgi:hypothetical protein
MLRTPFILILLVGLSLSAHGQSPVSPPIPPIITFAVPPAGYTIRLTVEVKPAGVLEIVADSKVIAIGVKGGDGPPNPDGPPPVPVPPTPPQPVTPPPVPPTPPAPITPPPVVPPPIDPSLPDPFGLAAFSRSLVPTIPFDPQRKALGLVRMAAAFQTGSEAVDAYFTPTALSVATANDVKARLGADYEAWKPYVIAPLQGKWRELNKVGKMLTKEELGRAYGDIARGLREANQ